MDRMCRELEAIGLPVPLFNNNTFILKTTVMSATWQKRPIQTGKPADSAENLPIRTAKPAVSGRKWPIQTAKVADSGEIANPGRPDKLEKISATAYTQAYMAKGYKGTTIQYLKEIYNQLEPNQVFGSAYLVKILECPNRIARRLLAKLREMDVVVAVTGKGKGMYRLKNVGE